MLPKANVTKRSKNKSGSVSKSKRAPKAAAACRRCRQRKQRCNGERPSCGNCKSANAVCDYENVLAEETRADAARRENTSLQIQMTSVLSSLESLQSMPKEDAVRWLADLRSSTDPLAVLHSARQAISKLTPPAPDADTALCTLPSAVVPFLPSSRSNFDIRLATQRSRVYPLFAFSELVVGAVKPPTAAYYGPFIAASETEARRPSSRPASPAGDAAATNLDVALCDERLAQLDLSFWSSVPMSSGFAARLLSLYLVTDHPLLPSFDPDLFIQDLTSNTLRFCTPLLVNSVLSWACQTYTAKEPAAASFANDFFEAAVLLLRAEENHESITTISALFSLTLRCIGYGDDAAAKSYLRALVKMSVSMRLYGNDRAGILEMCLFVPEWISAYSYVGWGAYNFSCIYLFHYRINDCTEFVRQPPILPIPGEQNIDYIGSMLAPPPPYMDQTFAMYCRLMPIYQDILSVQLGEQGKGSSALPLAFAEERYGRLLAWSDQLPLSLAFSLDMPHHAVILHANFHSIVLEVFRPFLRKNHRLSQIPYPGPRVEEVFLCASARLIDLHRLYQFKFQNTSAMHTITSFILPVYAANASLQGPPTTRSQRRQDFQLAMLSLMKLGFSRGVKATMIRGSMVLAVSSGLMSVKESAALLAEILGIHKTTASTADDEGDRPSDDDFKGDTPLMLDFDRALNVDALARQYASMNVTQD